VIGLAVDLQLPIPIINVLASVVGWTPFYLERQHPHQYQSSFHLDCLQITLPHFKKARRSYLCFTALSAAFAHVQWNLMNTYAIQRRGMSSQSNNRLMKTLSYYIGSLSWRLSTSVPLTASIENVALVYRHVCGVFRWRFSLTF
jgi:hypothetical protein